MARDYAVFKTTHKKCGALRACIHQNRLVHVAGFALGVIKKTIFSRKGAKDAKKKTFNIHKIPLRALRLCARF